MFVCLFFSRFSSPLWTSVYFHFNVFSFLPCTNIIWKMLMWSCGSNTMRILLSTRNNTICRKYERGPKVSRSYWLIDWFWSQGPILLVLFPCGGVSSLLSQHAPAHIGTELSVALSTCWVFFVRSEVRQMSILVFNTDSDKCLRCN